MVTSATAGDPPLPWTLGINTWVWTAPLTNHNLPGIARRVAAMGYGAIEIPLENLGDWDPARTGDVLADLSLVPVVIGAMGAGRSLVDGVGDVPQTMDYLRGCIRAAGAVGASVVAGPFYTPTGATWRMDRDERTRVVRELRSNLDLLAMEAHEGGVALAIEPLNRYETSLINTVEQALDALEPLLGPSLGLTLDTYHLNIEEKHPDEAIRQAGSAIRHVQVSGTDRGAVGNDHADWTGILDALEDTGYRGVLGVESFTGDSAIIAAAASVWRPLEPSQDVLATRSLQFLNDLQDSRWRGMGAE